MKICFILPHFYPYVGGAEKIFYDLTEGLVRRGHEVRVISSATGTGHMGVCRIDADGGILETGSAFSEEEKALQVRYCGWKEFFGHPLPAASDMEESIRWADVVHTSTFTPAPPVSRLARKYHKPSVLTVHEVHGMKWYWVDNFIRSTAFLVYEWYVCTRPFDLYHAVSEATRQDYFSFCGKRDVRRVYNADEMDPEMELDPEFDIHRFFDVEPEKRIFLYYGRPGKTKGVNVYEKALLMLGAMGEDLDNVRFCFALGAEPAGPRAEFVKSIEKNGLGDIVRIRGSLSRAALGSCILQADYVVVPSVTEGFGLSALEACQMGKKLIVSDGGALPEVVYGDILQFRNRDAKDLAEKLLQVIHKGEGAFQKIPPKQFTYEQMIGGIEQLYFELIKERA